MKARYFVVISGEKELRLSGVRRVIPASENWTAILSQPFNFVELMTAIDEKATEKGISHAELTLLQKLSVINEL